MTLKVLNPKKVCSAPRSLHLGGERIWSQAKIIKGKGRGKKLGFPTLNLQPEPDFGLSQGVYSCWAKLAGKIYPALLYWGPSLTFGEKAPRLEIYLFGFNQRFKKGKVSFKVIKFIRKGGKFASEQKLVAQIEKDRRQWKENV